MGFFDINTDLVAASDNEERGFVGLASKVYKVAVVAAYIIESGRSDAKALMIQYKTSESDDKIHYEALWYQGGTGKNTYVDKTTGAEKLLPSFTQMLNLFAAAGVDIDAVTPEELVVKHFGEDGKYPVFTDFTGKVMDFGIRHVLKDDYKDETEVDDTQEVELFIADDGRSGSEIRGAKNGYTKASWEKMIAKKPTKDQRKLSKGGATAPAATGGSESTTSVKSW